MGTRSTVKFYQDKKCVLSVYQQYDGYLEGVGQQVADLLQKYTLVNGLPLGDNRAIANGLGELALFYVMDNKEGNGNIYATTEDDSQLFNYEIHAEWVGSGFDGKQQVVGVVVKEGDDIIFNGSPEKFFNFIK